MSVVPTSNMHRRPNNPFAQRSSRGGGSRRVSYSGDPRYGPQVTQRHHHAPTICNPLVILTILGASIYAIYSFTLSSSSPTSVSSLIETGKVKTGSPLPSPNKPHLEDSLSNADFKDIGTLRQRDESGAQRLPYNAAKEGDESETGPQLDEDNEDGEHGFHEPDSVESDFDSSNDKQNLDEDADSRTEEDTNSSSDKESKGKDKKNPSGQTEEDGPSQDETGSNDSGSHVHKNQPSGNEQGTNSKDGDSPEHKDILRPSGDSKFDEDTQHGSHDSESEPRSEVGQRVAADTDEENESKDPGVGPNQLPVDDPEEENGSNDPDEVPIKVVDDLNDGASGDESGSGAKADVLSTGPHSELSARNSTLLAGKEDNGNAEEDVKGIVNKTTLANFTHLLDNTTNDLVAETRSSTNALQANISTVSNWSAPITGSNETNNATLTDSTELNVTVTLNETESRTGDTGGHSNGTTKDYDSLHGKKAKVSNASITATDLAAVVDTANVTSNSSDLAVGATLIGKAELNETFYLESNSSNVTPELLGQLGNYSKPANSSKSKSRHSTANRTKSSKSKKANQNAKDENVNESGSAPLNATTASDTGIANASVVDGGVQVDANVSVAAKNATRTLPASIPKKKKGSAPSEASDTNSTTTGEKSSKTKEKSKKKLQDGKSDPETNSSDIGETGARSPFKVTKPHGKEKSKTNKALKSPSLVALNETSLLGKLTIKKAAAGSKSATKGNDTEMSKSKKSKFPFLSGWTSSSGKTKQPKTATSETTAAPKNVSSKTEKVTKAALNSTKSRSRKQPMPATNNSKLSTGDDVVKAAERRKAQGKDDPKLEKKSSSGAKTKRRRLRASSSSHVAELISGAAERCQNVLSFLVNPRLL